MTAECKRFHDRLRDLGCMICKQLPSIHHVRTKRDRLKNDFKVIPLCYSHHQGDKGIEFDPRGFIRRYGSQESLLLKAYEKLGKLPNGAREQVKRIIADGFKT